VRPTLCHAQTVPPNLIERGAGLNAPACSSPSTKPFGVACKFSPEPGRKTLANYIDVRSVYPAGRLDTDSEGPDAAHRRRHLAGAHRGAEARDSEGVLGAGGRFSVSKLHSISCAKGVSLGDFTTHPAKRESHRGTSRTVAARSAYPLSSEKFPRRGLSSRYVRERNRQVRRMTAKVGFPTLRLIRAAIGKVSVEGLALGKWREIGADAPVGRPAIKGDRRRKGRSASAAMRRE